MYLGRIVESGAADVFLHDSRHPYTRALLASVPSPYPSLRSELRVISAEVPDAARPPSRCRFHPRCPFVMHVCPVERPVLRDIGGARRVACHLDDDFAFPPLARPTGGGRTSAAPEGDSDVRPNSEPALVTRRRSSVALCEKRCSGPEKSQAGSPCDDRQAAVMGMRLEHTDEREGPVTGQLRDTSPW